jgi:hypothetical protein
MYLDHKMHIFYIKVHYRLLDCGQIAPTMIVFIGKTCSLCTENVI